MKEVLLSSRSFSSTIDVLQSISIEESLGDQGFIDQ